MRLWNLTFLLIAALCLAPPSWAQGEKRVALIIGNDDYRSLKTLDNAVNDARLMERELKAAGFETVVKTNATRRDMNAAINAFADRIGKGATGLFYYAGHGVENQGQNYLIPVDAELETPRDLEDNAVAIDKVTRVMKEADDRLNIIVLDACRDNPMKTRS